MGNKQGQGFTLIELVVAIIILGILAVVAAPKFINLQSDARASTLDGVKGALQAANTLVLSKASIQGLETEGNQDVELSSGVFIELDYGYIKSFGDEQTTIDNLELAMDMTFELLTSNGVLATEDWGLRSTGNTFTIVPKGKAANGDCRLVYNEAEEDAGVITPPSYEVLETGC
ncbi:type II secretion system protein [Shewanella waksmanii]|uniref:type II secretion system protein n=1 Tax=Shewanella waksmanii TaxID=213783 RepID=UPI0004B303E1|nr:prepilin-type N-terminal cleavage/methylation domain-containing protein [Shewanella waksmanii]